MTSIHRISLRCALLLGVLIASVSGAQRITAQPAAPPAATPAASPWAQDFPPTGDLGIEWNGEIEAEGVRGIKRLRYNGATWDGKPMRIFALYGQPEGPGPFPAILQIHGGGQTAYPSNIAYFVKRGYACLSFDWAGLRDERKPEDVTVWPEEIAGSHTGTIEKQGRNGMVYQAAVAAVRGIDVLCAQPAVDRNRIGVQGISWGGYITWIVNGLDPRLKAAVATYGTGNLISQWGDMAEGLKRLTPAEQQFIRDNLDAAGFAKRQQSPILFVSGANDFFGQLPQAEGLLASIPSPTRRSYSPNRMHSLAPETVNAAMAWFAAQLQGDKAFPETPQMKVAVGADGQPEVTVEVDAQRPVRSVHIDYARDGRHPLLYCWLPAEAKAAPAGGGATQSYTASIAVVDTLQPLDLIAQVTYAGPQGDFTISSAAKHIVPALELQGSVATVLTSNIISDWDNGPGGWYISRGTDFMHAERPAAHLEAGNIGGHAAVICRTTETGELKISTRLPVDAARNRGNRRSLELWTHDLQGAKLKLNDFLREPGAKEHEAVIASGAGWQRTVLKLADFTPYDHPAGTPVKPEDALTSWNALHQLSIAGTPTAGGTPAIGLVRWTDETQTD